jgi:hypothetical protein
MGEKILLPNPIRSEAAQTGPRFDTPASRYQGEIDTIKKAKTNGWGAQIKNFFSNKKPLALLMSGIIVVTIAGGLVFATTQVDTEREGAALTSYTLPSTEGPGLASPASGTESGDFIITAEAGEGVTHLARKAVAQYLAATDTELNAEQAVFAEDYLRRIKGSYPLSTGDELTFTTEEIQAAVKNALALKDWQIKNLTQYTHNLTL